LMPPFIHLFIKIACMLSFSKHIIVHLILLLNFKKETDFFYKPLVREKLGIEAIILVCNFNHMSTPKSHNLH
jgi:uncharacterized protein (DUF1919 family)